MLDRKQQAQQVIDSLGGPTKVAELLGFSKHGGVQRVQNWKERGIPASVMLNHAALLKLPIALSPALQPPEQPVSNN